LNKPLEKAVRKFQKGDQSAFDIIYDETKKNIYYTILLIVKDTQTAEDLMQDTYMRMIEKIDQYNHKKQVFNAWLSTMAKNLAINYYNRKQKESIIDQNDNEGLFGSYESQNEDKYYLQSLLKTLSAEEQEIVVRHVILEEKHKTIAEAMNLPLGTVTWKYSEALKKLKKTGGDSHEQ